MVMGESKAPALAQLAALGAAAKFPDKFVRPVFARTQEALGHWRPLAKTYGVRAAMIRDVESRLTRV